MLSQPVIYNMMQLTEKLNKIQASYTLEGRVLENVESIKYLGVTITNDLKWTAHISNVCTKANRTLGFLMRTLFSSAHRSSLQGNDAPKFWSMEARYGVLIMTV